MVPKRGAKRRAALDKRFVGLTAIVDVLFALGIGDNCRDWKQRLNCVIQ